MTNDPHDRDATPELQDEFWGQQTEWTSRPEPSAERPSVGDMIGRWWDGLFGGSDAATRAHGQRSARTEHSDTEHSDTGGLSPVDRMPGHTVDHEELGSADADDAWEFEPEPQPVRRAGVDPLIARLGGLAVVLTLAAPVVIGFTASDSDADGALLATIAGDAPAEPTPTVIPASPASTAAADPADAIPASPSSDVTPATTVAAVSSDDAPETSSTPVAAAALEADPAAETPTIEPATTPATTPATAVPACGNDYELAAGDYWIRIADAADVTLADLLRVNSASVDTVLVPGRSICLPAGASTPAPPTTVATPAARPSTAATNGDSSSTRSTTAATTPPTTAAPAPTTTAAPARPAAVPESEATAIIREIWPDELEERALEIAWRESNHRSNVNNFCCYGLFQIYYSVHRSWLSTLGINSAQDLFDPRANTIAAYTLYQRAGGWGPWGF